MAFLGKGKKQDMLQLAEELGINATLNMTVPSIKIAITSSEGYEEEFGKNLYETIIANGKRLEELERVEKMRLEELERAEKIRLEELVKEQALKEKELQLKFDLERLKIESGFRIVQFIAREPEEQAENYDYVKKLLLKRFKLSPEVFRQKFVQHQKKSDSTWKDFTFEITNYLDEWLIGLEINTFQDLKDLMLVDQLKKRANASMKDHFLDNWANLKSTTQIAELFDNYEDVRKVNSKPIDSPELACLPLAVVEISGNFGTVQTKAAVCGNHLNQHGRYLLGNKTAELIKGNLGYNFLPVEILNAVQTRSQVKAAREERGIYSGDAKKGEDEAIIVSSDAEDEILIPALQEYVPELALLRVTRENLINAQKNSEEIKSLYEQAASQVQVTNQVYSLEKELFVKNREDKLGNLRYGLYLTKVQGIELVHGKNLRTPETLVMEHWMEPEEEGDLVTGYMFKLINRLKRCQEVTINKMEEMQVKRKTWYDKNAVKREFKDGDLVLVLATSRANKLAVQWIGPGTILNKISETNYLVEIPDRRETSQIYHINMLKPYDKRPEHVNVIINDETQNSLADQEL
ncbi:retrovirus-related Pol polyprotein from transposon 17.6 [Trichonephila clavipes]|nr:retrovirus-related Pol polyprotein from transposon 17.6 [Trichonephila clavipes]